MVKILVVDDHAVVRRGLKQIISETPDMTVIGEATNGLEALEEMRKQVCDVMILDISMPGPSGLTVLKQVKAEWPDVKVIMLTMHPETQYAVLALRSGASGYLTKESAPEELLTAVRKVMEGRKYVGISLAEKLALELEPGERQLPHVSLSEREFQVLCLIASGKTVTQVAAETSLSPKTVSTYRTRILHKMGMKSNAELTYYAIKNKLID